jgi:hypothetical protein
VREKAVQFLDELQSFMEKVDAEAEVEFDEEGRVVLLVEFNETNDSLVAAIQEELFRDPV